MKRFPTKKKTPRGMREVCASVGVDQRATA